jgi:adenosylcobyric acid synthase
VAGYEIHVGRTHGDHPWLRVAREDGSAETTLDGLVNENGRVWGCYVHGLFANDAFRRAWLASLDGGRTRPALSSTSRSFQDSLDSFARVVKESLDMEGLERIIREPVEAGPSR